MLGGHKGCIVSNFDQGTVGAAASFGAASGLICKFDEAPDGCIDHRGADLSCRMVCFRVGAGFVRAGGLSETNLDNSILLNTVKTRHNSHTAATASPVTVARVGTGSQRSAIAPSSNKRAN